VQLLGKGRKQRMVPLWKETAQHIRAWLKLAGLKPDQPLLPNRFGRPMSRTAVQQRLQLHVQTAQANCPSLRRRRISPHTIRHATAMNLLQSGVAAPVIALWLGHEGPATYPSIYPSRSPHEGKGLATSATAQRKANPI
jgi:integrase/recombinase XerD